MIKSIALIAVFVQLVFSCKQRDESNGGLKQIEHRSGTLCKAIRSDPYFVEKTKLPEHVGLKAIEEFLCRSVDNSSVSVGFAHLMKTNGMSELDEHITGDTDSPWKSSYDFYNGFSVSVANGNFEHLDGVIDLFCKDFDDMKAKMRRGFADIISVTASKGRADRAGCRYTEKTKPDRILRWTSDISGELVKGSAGDLIYQIDVAKGTDSNSAVVLLENITAYWKEGSTVKLLVLAHTRHRVKVFKIPSHGPARSAFVNRLNNSRQDLIDLLKRK